MNEFITALCSSVKSERIPEEADLFGSLIGEWNIVWNDHLEDDTPRRSGFTTRRVNLGIYSTAVWGRLSV